ncbi:hypothetical protein OQA88_8200 [Cercophora sp. LCS_1]
MPASFTEQGPSQPETPSRPPRNKLRKKKEESPVKERISLFESLSQPAIGDWNLSKKRRPKSYDSGAHMERRLHPAWDFKRSSRLLRALSFGSKGSRIDLKAKETKDPGPKPSFESAKGCGVADTQGKQTSSTASQADSVVMAQGTVYNISNQEVSSERSPVPQRPTAVPAAGTAAWSSMDLVNNTSERPPTLFHSSSSKSGRILPTRKSYGALEPKPVWPAASFTDPFNNGEANPRVRAHSPIPSRKSRYPSSYGHKADNLKRQAHGPILSPDQGEGHSFPKAGDAVPARDVSPAPPVDLPVRQTSLSMSWGRRAAAAAFAIGRRLKERRTSARSQSVQSRDGAGSQRAVSREDE